MTEFDSWKAQEAAAYLNRVRRSSLDVRRIQDEIEMQRSLVPAGFDTSRERVRASAAPDALEQAALRVMDLVEEYCTELAAYVEMQREAHESINRMDDARHRAVLTLYYIDGHSWETIGTSRDERTGKVRQGLLNYSVDWCKELRSQALPLFWEVMPIEWKTNVPRAD